MTTALVLTAPAPPHGTHEWHQDPFVATLAHELRNQLAPALNALEVMKRADSDAGLRARALATMERQAGYLTRLLDDLLDLSRIAHHRLGLKPVRVNLGLLLEEALEAGRCAVEAAHHSLRVTLPAEPVFLEGDALRLTQVFANLLTNACKYTNPGGRIEVVIELQGSDVLVRVGDSGIGIPPGLLAEVFEPFVQLGPAKDLSQGGLGLGLALARRLVEEHGGTLTAHSDGPGRGSEFVVRLPILTNQPLVHSPTSPPAQPALAQRQRLLLVDDSHDAVESLAVLLRQNGYEVRTADNGVQALAEAAAYRPEVILLDIGLPGLSGLDVCRAIRAEPWGKAIVMIALTGWGRDDDRRRSSEAGFDGHLLKPVDFAVLTSRLERAGNACPLFV